MFVRRSKYNEMVESRDCSRGVADIYYGWWSETSLERDRLRAELDSANAALAATERDLAKTDALLRDEFAHSSRLTAELDVATEKANHLAESLDRVTAERDRATAALARLVTAFLHVDLTLCGDIPFPSASEILNRG